MSFLAVLIPAVLLIGALPLMFCFIMSKESTSTRGELQAETSAESACCETLRGGGMAGWSRRPLFENHFLACSCCMSPLDGELHPLPVSSPIYLTAAEAAIMLVCDVMFISDA